MGRYSGVKCRVGIPTTLNVLYVYMDYRMNYVDSSITMNDSKRLNGIWITTALISIPPPIILFNFLVQGHGISPMHRIDTWLLVLVWNVSLILWCNWYPISFWQKKSSSLHPSLAGIVFSIIIWLLCVIFISMIKSKPFSFNIILAMSVSVGLVLVALGCFIFKKNIADD